MATGLETAIARTAGQIIRHLGGHVGKQAQLRRARDSARPLMARRVADDLLGELSAAEATELAAYLTSPDFEQVALQFAVARLHPRDAQRDELLSAARAQIRQGLRLATTLPPERRLGITDVVFDALLAAEHTPGNPAQAARLGHLVAMAARNGELLGRLEDLSACRTEAQRLRSQVAALHAELRMPHTGVSRSVPWDQLYVESRPQDMRRESAPVRELAQTGRRLVVLGDPGAGKSTLATKLAYDLAADPAGTEVPFLVVLRHLSSALQTGERTLAEHLLTVARDPHNVAMSAETVDYLLLNGQAVVILDGLDELTDVSLRRRLTELVRGFATLYPMVPMVVTSRRVGYREAALDVALFPVHDLMPFDAGQVEKYIGHWFALDDGTPPADRQRLAESFLRDSASIEDLRSNPLLLALLCAMYATDHYLPRLRAQIYERCALMVFERWDSMRGIGRQLEFEGRVRGAVQHLAWHLLTEDEAELPRHQIVRLLVGHLIERGLGEDDAEAAAREFLDFCAGRAWVLAEVGSTDLEPAYGFAHRTFLEFFAAEHLVRTRKTPEGVWGELIGRVRTGQWEVVAQLALQLLDRNTLDGAETLVRAAMEDALRSPVRERQRLARFGASALQHVTLPPALVDEVVEVAVRCYFAVPAENRFRAILGDLFFDDMADSDAPLAVATHLALPGNQPSVRRATESAVIRRIEAGDDRGHLLLATLTKGNTLASTGVSAEWGELQKSIERKVSPGHDRWRARWGLSTEFATDHLDDLYRFQTSMGSSSSWIGFFLLHVLPKKQPDVRALVDHLVDRPTPWFSGASWQIELQQIDREQNRFLRPWEMSLFDHSDRDWKPAFLLLTLPYLELARDFGDPGSELVPRGISVIRQGIDGEVADYLRRWDAGEFRVLGT
jgi:hypothetical protein